MPEQHDPDLISKDLLGLTDLTSDEPFEMPATSSAVGQGVIPADFAEDPTLRARPLPALLVGRAWYKGLGWGFWVAVVWVVLWILAAIFAGVLPLQNPDTLNANCIINSNPSAAHLLGCDNIGRDLLSRVIYGSRVSLVVGFVSIALSQIVGGFLGVLAGYFRGTIDRVFGVISNVFLSFPSLVLGLVIVSYLGHSEIDIVLIISIVAWPLLYRVVRAATIEYSQREYVLAAQALGSTRSRILFKIVLPDILPSAITYGLVGVALAIVGEGALSFIGQSVAPPTPTWGNMIASGTDEMPQFLGLLLAPAVAMFSFILAINFVGDRLRSILDVRQGAL
ncbi:MAG: ABC transporter permease [Acidimicrobiales bacterium]